MQAAAPRSVAAARQHGADTKIARPHLVTADDTGLLDALPIAAAIIIRDDQRALEVAAHNGRFARTVDQSTCTALDWNEAQCLKGGTIA